MPVLCLSQDGRTAALQTISRALGVECSHRHLDDLKRDDKPTKRTARLMLRLFDEIPTYFDKSRQPSMQCYSCHQGSPKPQRVPA